VVWLPLCPCDIPCPHYYHRHPLFARTRRITYTATDYGSGSPCPHGPTGPRFFTFAGRLRTRCAHGCVHAGCIYTLDVTFNTHTLRLHHITVCHFTGSRYHAFPLRLRLPVTVLLFRTGVVRYRFHTHRGYRGWFTHFPCVGCRAAFLHVCRTTFHHTFPYTHTYTQVTTAHIYSLHTHTYLDLVEAVYTFPAFLHFVRLHAFTFAASPPACAFRLPLRTAYCSGSPFAAFLRTAAGLQPFCTHTGLVCYIFFHCPLAHYVRLPLLRGCAFCIRARTVACRAFTAHHAFLPPALPLRSALQQRFRAV